MDKLIIDRFEGNFAVCEKTDRTKVNLEKNRLPTDTKEGSCIILTDNGTIIMDEERDKIRANTIKNLMANLFAGEDEIKQS